MFFIAVRIPCVAPNPVSSSSPNPQRITRLGRFFQPFARFTRPSTTSAARPIITSAARPVIRPFLPPSLLFRSNLVNLFRRNPVNHNRFTPCPRFVQPRLVQLCSAIRCFHLGQINRLRQFNRLRQLRQINPFPAFHSHFPAAAFPRPTPVRRREESQQRTSPPPTPPVREQSQQREHDEAQVRRDYGIAPDEDLFGGFVQRTNDQRHEQALRTNTDGGAYFKTVIDDHIQSLPNNEKVEFKKKVEESDPELFLELPNFAVEKAISSKVALTRGNTPAFIHNHLDQLEKLRKEQQRLNKEELKKQIGKIAILLAREADCIASMQHALEAFSKQ